MILITMRKWFKIRQEKVELIANDIPRQELVQGEAKGKLLVLGWGSTYGAIRTAVKQSIDAGLSVSQAHIRYINPFPKTLGKNPDVLIPELNQLLKIQLINAKYGTKALPLNKIKGMPFASREIKERILELV